VSVRVGAKVKYVDNAKRFLRFMDQGLFEAFDIIGFEMEKEIRASFKDGKGVPSTAPAPPHFQIGKLSAHIAHQVIKHGTGKGDRVLRMGVRKLKYSIIHEIGMTTKKDEIPTMSEASYAVTVEFEIVETKEAGPRACMDINDKLRDRLNRQSFTITGASMLAATLGVERGPVNVDQAYVQTVDYLIRGFAS
jgi:hypothetical protein